MASPDPRSSESLPVDTTSLDGINYLFGFPIAHSLSPLLHNTVYSHLNLSRAQIPLPSRDLNDLLSRAQDPKFFGSSCTMPHKIAVIPHLDRITPEASEVGAVNTIYVQNDPDTGKRLLCGTNTDVVGIREAFYQNVKDKNVFENRPGVVVGGGGAARSAVYAMYKYMSIRRIYLVNRDPAEIQALCEQLAEQQTREKERGQPFELIHVIDVQQANVLDAPGAIVSCIPDFAPVSAAEKQARAILEAMLGKQSKGAILEMCYHPNPWTQIADIAETAGWQVILGTEAMIYQGLEQDRYWTGLPTEKLPVKAVKAAVAEALTRSSL